MFTFFYCTQINVNFLEMYPEPQVTSLDDDIKTDDLIPVIIVIFYNVYFSVDSFVT